MKIIKNLFYYLFLIFIFLNCLFYREFSNITLKNTIFESIYITDYFLIFGFAYIFFQLLINRDSFKRIFSKQMLIPIIFFIWCIGNFLFLTPELTLNKLKYFSSSVYFLFYSLVIYEFKDLRNNENIFKTICFAALISLLVLIPKVIIGGRSVGEFTTTTGALRFASFEFISLSFLLTSYFGMFLNKFKNKLINGSIFFGTLIAILFLINSRSGSIGTFLSLFIVLFFSSKNLKLKNASNILLGSSSFLILLLPILIKNLDNIYNSILRLGSISDFGDANISWRLMVWSISWKNMNLSDFLIGKGWGYENPAITFTSGKMFDQYYLHNSYLFFLQHIGLIGLILLMTIIFSIYKEAFAILSDANSNNSILRQRILALLSGHISLLIFSFYNVMFEVPYLSIPFWVTLGLLKNYCDNENFNFKNINPKMKLK